MPYGKVTSNRTVQSLAIFLTAFQLQCQTLYPHKLVPPFCLSLARKEELYLICQIFMMMMMMKKMMQCSSVQHRDIQATSSSSSISAL